MPSGASGIEQVLYFEYNTVNLMQLVLTASGSVAHVNIVTTVGSGILSMEGGRDDFIYFSTQDTIYRFTPPGATHLSCSNK